MIKDVLAMFNALVKLVVLMKANNIPLLYPTIYLLRKWFGPLSVPVHKKIKGQFSCNTVFKTSWSLFIKKHYFEIQSISWTVLIYNSCLKKVLNVNNITVARFFYLFICICMSIFTRTYKVIKMYVHTSFNCTIKCPCHMMNRWMT